tara:strand:+ start:413 stop:622 length:210 start_codon:yes stop_codon:yes gene_type:complete
MKVGDLVRFKRGGAPFHPFHPHQRGIIVGDDGFSVDVYWYKDAIRGRRRLDGQIISELKEFLEVVNESG